MKQKKPNKLIKILLITAATILAFFILLNIYNQFKPENKNIIFGVSFTPQRAQSLGLDWKKTYLDILNNLKVKNLRIPSYWNQVENQQGNYNFSDLDFMINKANKAGAKITLVLGIKQPGWPECYIPSWAKKLTIQQRQKENLKLIETIVTRYKNVSAIYMWQVENEPLFSLGQAINFGIGCDPQDFNYLQKEVNLVKQLDPNRKVIVTDSGELSPWIQAMKSGNVFGTTLYRKVNNPIFGDFTYPLPPSFYTVKSNFIRIVFAPNNTETIISELQAEPWFSKSLDESTHDLTVGVSSLHGLTSVSSNPRLNSRGFLGDKTSINEQASVFSLQDFKNNIEYAKKTNFNLAYLWGVEWWYYMAKHGHPEYLQFAKTLFEN